MKHEEHEDCHLIRGIFFAVMLETLMVVILIGIGNILAHLF